MKNYEYLKTYKTIAIMGGTFDPIHNGHLFVAEEVINKFDDIEKIFFVPTGISHQKKYINVTNSYDRLSMVELATSDNTYFEVCDIEVDRQGETYTVDTLKEIINICPENTKIYFILGYDSFLGIESWKEFESIFNLCEFILVRRTVETYDSEQNISQLKDEYKIKCHFLYNDIFGISSSKLKYYIKKNKQLTYSLPSKVIEFIKKENLYKNSFYNIEAIDNDVKSVLSDKRYTHTIGVANLSEKLAIHYSIDSEKAYVAGLLHDYCKELSKEDKYLMCHKYNINLDKERNVNLFHGLIGANVIKDKFGIIDKDIFNSIANHTMGRINMSMLEKIVYIADAVEVNRETTVLVEEIRNIMYDDIDKAIFLTIKMKIDYTVSKNQVPNNKGIEALNYYRELIKI